MDPLQEIPPEKWPSLQERLRESWPANIGGFYALYVNVKHPKLRAAFQFKVYSPGGNVENGFIATNVKGETIYMLLFPASEDSKKLEDALIKTKVIDWRKAIHLSLIMPPALKIVFNIVKPLLGPKRTLQVVPLSLYYFGSNRRSFGDLSCPEHTYMSSVKKDDIQHVNDTWHYKYPASEYFYEILATHNLSYGLYSSEDHKLLAWIFLNDYGYLTHLYCEKEQRRKGYGEYLIKYVVNDQLLEGNDIYGFVANNNEKALALFIKLSFTYVEKATFCHSDPVL